MREISGRFDGTLSGVFELATSSSVASAVIPKAETVIQERNGAAMKRAAEAMRRGLIRKLRRFIVCKSSDHSMIN